VVATPTANFTLTQEQVGGNFVINGETNGGPAAPITVTLPVVVGTFDNPDSRYNGIRGGLFNGSATLTHLLDAGSQKINGSTSALNIPPLHFAEWIGNGNQNDPWLCRISPLVAASA
jgi:hypothetical protein